MREVRVSEAGGDGRQGTGAATVRKAAQAECETAHLMILVAKSTGTRDHAHYSPRSTRGHDPRNDFATNIT